jgi:F-type H+-transporting ATPase subunit alpha
LQNLMEQVLGVLFSEGLVGLEVVTSLGQPIDDKGPIATDQFIALERLAPGVIDRQPFVSPWQLALRRSTA